MILDQLLFLSAVYPTGPLDDYWYGHAGHATTAGVSIDESTGLNYSACWAATRVLCTGAWLPFNLFVDEPTGKRIATEHRVQQILNNEFNPNVKAIMGRSAGISQQVNWGNYFAEIERDGRGGLLNLWPIHASRMQPYYDEQLRLIYRVRNVDGTITELDPPDVFHVPSMMSDDGIFGKGVIRHARETIGHALAKERYGAGWFGSGGRPSAVLKHPTKMEKDARDNLRREWNEIYGGPGSTHKIAVLWEGMDYQAIASSPEDSQFLQSSQFSIEEIARWYGVSPHLIGHLLRATFNNIEQLGIEFVKYSLLAWLRQWEQEVHRKLLTKQEQLTYFAKHDVDELERGDLMSRTSANAQQLFNGALTVNQWCEKEGRNTVGPAGDIHWIQSAMIPLDDAANRPQPGEPPPEGAAKSKEKLPGKNSLAVQPQNAAMLAASLEVLAEIVGVMVEREAREALAAAKKPSEFNSWLDTFYVEHEKRLAKSLDKPIRACLLAAGSAELPSDFVAGVVKAHITAGREMLLAAASVQSGELLASVESCVETWERKDIVHSLYSDDQQRDEAGRFAGGGSHEENAKNAAEATVKAKAASENARPSGVNGSREQHKEQASRYRTAQKAHEAAGEAQMKAHYSAPESERQDQRVGDHRPEKQYSAYRTQAGNHASAAKNAKVMAIFHEKMAKQKGA